MYKKTGVKVVMEEDRRADRQVDIASVEYRKVHVYIRGNLSSIGDVIFSLIIMYV